MEAIGCRWVYSFLLTCFFLCSIAQSVKDVKGRPKVRAVNLGGWLVVEGWMYEKPTMFDTMPNPEMIDGRQVQFKSVVSGKYVSAENGGGQSVSVNRSTASSWETFRLWRVTKHKFQFRTSGGQFLSCDGEGSLLSAKADSPSMTETFYIEKNNKGRVHIRLLSGAYLQATSPNHLSADYLGKPGWDDNKATFEMIIVSDKLEGEYQLANGYGPDRAKEILTKHRSSYITAEDFKFLSRNGINTVRIPVGWWIAMDPNPPAPFIGGSLAALDNAFSWAQDYNIKCIIDLHAAPGSQNGWDHSGTRDGTIDWPNHTSETLSVIKFLASRYAKHPALLGIELLNEPRVSGVPLDVLVSFYKEGYRIVRKYSSTAYVILSQRNGDADPVELLQANIGSSNVVVDLHYYNLFSSIYSNFTVADHIKYIYEHRKPEVQRLQSANGPLIFIGEWVTEMNLTSASQSDYQKYGKAQLDVYGASSFGWAYWSYKCVQNHWSLRWSIENNYIQLGKS